jgi:hypothetical protein
VSKCVSYQERVKLKNVLSSKSVDVHDFVHSQDSHLIPELFFLVIRHFSDKARVDMCLALKQCPALLLR